MSGGIVSFGTYTFPKTLKEFMTNFGDVVPATVRMPGLDGAWNSDGDGDAPTQTGKVTVGFTLIADTREEMDDLRDVVRGLRRQGLARLVYQPTDPLDPARFCLARVNMLNMSERKDSHTDYWQDVQIIFQVPDPVWKVNNYAGHTIGEAGLVIDDPATWTIGGGSYNVAASAPLTTVTVPYVGNAPAIPKILIEPGVGNSCENVIIERVVDGLVVDRVAYTGVIGESQYLSIDGEAQMVTVNAVNAWGDIDYLHPDLVRMEPGKTTFNIRFKNTSDAATVRFYFYDHYR
ncbi:MAG: hypothetical protein D6698_16305 [Gammaproteobacteria bacterium]|nr:MAG: hypothetical protein D6698_16305 [Gammaproteobacteria bacterium]